MSRELEQVSRALNEHRARIDRALNITPPGDDVPDYTTGFTDALSLMHEALTTPAPTGDGEAQAPRSTT